MGIFRIVVTEERRDLHIFIVVVLYMSFKRLFNICKTQEYDTDIFEE